MLKYLSLVMLAVLALGLPMLLPGPDGKAVMQPKDWLPEPESTREVLRLFEGASEIVPGESTLELNLPRSEYYRWQDAQGRWHYSDVAPPQQAEKHVLPNIDNSLPAPPAQSTGPTLQNDPRVQQMLDMLGQRLGQTAE